MKYFKYLEEEEQVTTLVELDKQFVCHRAIFIEKNNMHTTNRVDKGTKYFLPEGSFENFTDHFDEISTQEFISIWKKANKKLRSNFEIISNHLYIGKKLKAGVICFYPQGIVFDCNAEFNGIADYNECLKEFGKERMYPHELFEMEVCGIDKKNLMIELKPANNKPHQ